MKYKQKIEQELYKNTDMLAYYYRKDIDVIDLDKILRKHD